MNRKGLWAGGLALILLVVGAAALLSAPNITAARSASR
jgi:hypothetical protein